MARRLTTVGTEFQVNQAPGQNNGQLNPDAVALSDGRFFVGFEDDGRRWRPRHRRPVRQPQRHALRSKPGIRRHGSGGWRHCDIEFDPAVAARTTGAGAGGVVAVYENRALTPATSSSPSSTPRVPSPWTDLNVFASGLPERDPDVATLSDGRSLIVFESGLRHAQRHLGRILNAAGTAFIVGAFSVALARDRRTGSRRRGGRAQCAGRL